MSTLSAQHWDSKVKIDPYCIEEFYFWENNLNPIKSAIVFSLISHSVSLTPMLALRGVVQLLPLMRIVCVTSFGSLQSALSLEELWDAHTVDCFADFYVAELSRFFSRFWNPGASGIDFFAQELSSENCLVVPPVSLVARVIHYLSLQKAMATLVVPSWPSSSFWRLLTSKYLWFIKGCFTLNASQTLTLGRNLSSFLGSPRFTGEVVALRFEFL